MKKILIIEDDPIVAHIYRTRLEKAGCTVEICADGQAGFYRIHEYHPDGVLLDLMLPKMNGVEILKKIRAQSQFQKTPIIVFTNAYVPNMIHEAFQAGATQVFNKATLTPRQIMDALNNAVCLDSPRSAETAVNPNPGEGAGASNRLDIGDTLADPPFHSDGASPSRVNGGSAVKEASPDSSLPEPSLAGDSAASAFPTESEEGGVDDEQFQAELLQSFLASAPETLAALRKSMQDFSKIQDESARLPLLLEVFRKVHGLTGSAGIAGLTAISQMAAALEILVKELYEKPKNLNASTLRTVAHSIDFICELFTKGADAEIPETPPINILVVDDEILSRRAITYALEKAGLKSVSVEEPQVALNLAKEATFDLIFLDVQMPGMDGFDLCKQIRALPSNKNTPVIFVTSLTDFKSRAKSSLSGGTDLIAKPFMFIELSVKALTYVLRGRLTRPKQQAA